MTTNLATLLLLTTVTQPQYVNLFELPINGHLESVGVRLADSRKNFDGVSQESLIINFSTPWGWFLSRNISATLYFGLNAGQFRSDQLNRNFVSFGPSIRMSIDRWNSPLFVDFGLSPTIIDGMKYGTEDLGTSFNFTSHIGLGVLIGKDRRNEIKLRYQHISNGGINKINPGVDMVGIDYIFRIRR